MIGTKTVIRNIGHYWAMDKLINETIDLTMEVIVDSYYSNATSWSDNARSSSPIRDVDSSRPWLPG